MLMSGFLLVVACLVTHVTTVLADYDADCVEPGRAQEACADSEEACPVLPVCVCAPGFQLNAAANICEPKPRPSFDMQGNRLEISKYQNFDDSLKKKVESISRDANELKKYLSSRYDEINAKRDSCSTSNKSRDKRKCRGQHGKRGHSKIKITKPSKSHPALEIRVFLDGSNSEEGKNKIDSKRINKLPLGMIPIDPKKMKNPLIPMPRLMFMPNIPPQYYQSLGMHNPSQPMFPMPFPPHPMPFPPHPMMMQCTNLGCTAINATTSAPSPSEGIKKEEPPVAAAADPPPAPPENPPAPEAAEPPADEAERRRFEPKQAPNARLLELRRNNYYPIRDTQNREQRIEKRKDNISRRGTMHKNIEPYYPDKVSDNEDYVNKFTVDGRYLRAKNASAGWQDSDIEGPNLRGRNQDDSNEENRAVMHQNLNNVNNYGDYVSVFPKPLKDEKYHEVDYVVKDVRLPNTFNRVRSRSQPNYYDEKYLDDDSNLDDQIRSLVRKVYLRGKRQKYSLVNKEINDNIIKVENAYSAPLINLQSIMKEISESDIEVLDEPAMTNESNISQETILTHYEHVTTIKETSTQSVFGQYIPSVRTTSNEVIKKMPYVSSFVYKVLDPESSVDGINGTHRIEYTIKDKHLMQIPAVTGQTEKQNTFEDEIVHQIELELLGQNQNAIANSVLNPYTRNNTFSRMTNVDIDEYIMKENSHETLIKANLENSNNEMGNISKILVDPGDLKSIMDNDEVEKVVKSPTDMKIESNIVNHEQVTMKPLLNSLDLQMTSDKVTYILNRSYLPKHG